MLLRIRISRKVRMRMLTITFFFFNDTATTEIYTLSLHDALPIFRDTDGQDIETVEFEPNVDVVAVSGSGILLTMSDDVEDRKSTRLESRHLVIPYARFWLKKKKSCPCCGPYGRRYLRRGYPAP